MSRQVEEHCDRQLLECAAETSDDGTYHAQKIDLCLMAAGTECSEIFEQRTATTAVLNAKNHRRARTSAVWTMWSEGNNHVLHATKRSEAVPDFEAVRFQFALAGGNAVVWAGCLVIGRLIRTAYKRRRRPLPTHDVASSGPASPSRVLMPRAAVGDIEGGANDDTEASRAIPVVSAEVEAGQVRSQRDRIQ